MNTQAAPRKRGPKSNAEKAAIAAAAAQEASRGQPIDIDEGGDDEDAVEVAPVRRNRPDPRAQVRQPVRESNRAMPRAGGEVRGRDGEVLTRSRKSSTDPFEISTADVPAGWSYQWNAFQTFGAVEADRQRAMWENGWRPVPMSRYPGRFAPVGTEGDIVRDGLRLEERPLQLTMEAQAEERQMARRQVTNQREQLGLAVQKEVGGGGFAADPRAVRGTGVRQLDVSMAPDPEAPRGGYEYE